MIQNYSNHKDISNVLHPSISIESWLSSGEADFDSEHINSTNKNDFQINLT